MLDSKKAHRSSTFDELVSQVMAESGIGPSSMLRYFARLGELQEWLDGGVRKRSALEKTWRARYADHGKRTRTSGRARRAKVVDADVG